MKTLFGMTAAVLMVVMMLVVAVPGSAAAAEGDECTLGQVDYEYRTLPNPRRDKRAGTTVCLDDKTAFTPMGRYLSKTKKEKDVCNGWQETYMAPWCLAI